MCAIFVNYAESYLKWLQMCFQFYGCKVELEYCKGLLKNILFGFSETLQGKGIKKYSYFIKNIYNNFHVWYFKYILLKIVCLLISFMGIKSMSITQAYFLMLQIKTNL